MRFVHLHQTELHLAARLSNGLLQCYGCMLADCMDKVSRMAATAT